MRNIQIIGFGLSILILIYAIYRYRIGRSRRIELVAGVVISAGLGIESLYPEVGDLLTRFFVMQNRFFAVLLVAVLLLFGLFFYLLSQITDLRQQIGMMVRQLAKDRYQGEPRSGAAAGSLTVVIPAYNEEETILEVLKGIPQQVHGLQTEVLVIVDGAKDGTAQVVQQARVPVASHIMNRGQGDALKTGFEIAIERGAEIAVTMDADGQHLPSELNRLVEPIVQNRADFVLGSRFLGHYEERGSARHLGIVLFTRLLNALAGTRLTDITNGYRAIRTRDLMRLDLKEPQFSAPELIMKAALRGVRIMEVPVTIKSRGSGESKKPRGLGYPFGLGWTIVRCWLQSTRRVGW